MKKQTQSLTKEQYTVLDDAYRVFNKQLFDNQLPDCMILMHRKGKNNLGYYHPERFVRRADLADKKKKAKDIVRTDELSLNPDNFVGRSDTAILSTLAHEMAHVWQYRCTDHYPRNGYHDKKWGAKMKEIGLYPSNTGDVGGKETGQQMTHYIMQGGKFEKVCIAFLKNKSIKLTSYPLASKGGTQSKNKTKYTCPSCGMNAWAKPSANINCGDCDERLEEV